MSEQTSFVPAICTKCGARLTVDPTQDAAVCEYCGTPFIVEKAINNYNTNVVNYNEYHNTENTYTTKNIQINRKGLFGLIDGQLQREHEKEMAEQKRKDDIAKRNAEIEAKRKAEREAAQRLALARKNHKETAGAQKTLYWIIGIIIIGILISALSSLIENEQDKSLRQINTEFSGDTTLQSIEGIKYKVPKTWNKQDNDGSITFKTGSSIIFCSTIKTKYSTDHAEEAVESINNDPAVFDLHLTETVMKDKKKISIGKGTVFVDDTEYHMTTYIIGNDYTAFIEFIVSSGEPDAATIKDAEALIASVYF